MHPPLIAEVADARRREVLAQAAGERRLVAARAAAPPPGAPVPQGARRRTASTARLNAAWRRLTAPRPA